VDRKAVDEYLNNLGGFVLTSDDFIQLAQQTLSQFRDQNKRSQLVTVSQLYDRLKVELTALQATQMYFSGLDGFSTGELWEYHGRLHRRYKIEAYPLDVAARKSKFKSSDAKEEELRKIHEDGKDRVPHPEFYQPGFRQPRRIAFGYVKADFATFLEAAKKQIPEEKIAEEYQKEIAAGNFRKLDLPSSDTTKPPETKATPPADGDKPAKQKPAAGEGEPKQPTGGGDAKEKEKGKTDGSKAAEKEADKKGEPAEPKPASAESESNENKACENEPTKNAVDAAQPKKDGAKTGDAAKSEKTKGKSEEPAAKTKSASAAKSDEPESQPAAPADDKPAADKPADKPPADPTQATAKEPEFKPLSEVREELLTKLARPEARAASDAAVKAVSRAVQDYSVKYLLWIESKKAGGKSTVKDPGELRIKSLASKYNLIAGETALADQFEIAKTELGPHVGDEYFKERPLYAPQQAESFRDEGSYVYWRTQDQPSAEVPYEKARPQVVDAWIRQKAAEAARKDAETLAEKAAKADSLQSALTEEEAKKVLQPLPFSWFTVGTTPLAFGGAPRLSEVIGIPLAGNEFMESVFALKVGETGVAINQAHTVVYVVRVVAEEPAMDIRREMFLSSLQAGMFGDLARFAIMEREELTSDVVENLNKEFQLQWVESPRFDPGM
jgi:hypothetical protein